MAKKKVNKIDDFLEGSYFYYNHNVPFKKDYVFYPRIFGFQKIGPNYYNEMEDWNEYTLILTVHGSGELFTNGRTYNIKEGDLIFLENVSFHSLKAIQGTDWFINFVHLYPNKLLSDIFQTINSKFGPVIHGVPDELIRPYTDMLCKYHLEADKDMDLNMSKTIYDMLLGLVAFTNHISVATSNSTVRNIVSYIKENFTSNITMESILDQCHYSKTHLERVFKKEMKQSIKQYICQLRVQLAKELIVSTNASFEKIATMVGLSEYRSLHYLFTTYAHMTPSQYKRKKKKIK